MDTKNEIRSYFRNARKSVTNHSERSLLAVKHLYSISFWKNAQTVLLYHSMQSELSTVALIQMAQREGKTVLLPVIQSKDGSMGVGVLDSLESLTVSGLQIPEPPLSPNYPVDTIDCIVVPGVAFDRDGGRVGQGGGFYDRFLAAVSSPTIGVCFDCQLSQTPLPMDSHDVQMDFLVTESGVISCQ